jgi:hypothetical protein
VSRVGSPTWLAELQQQFGSVLRTPLDARSGSLRAQPEQYEAQLVAAVSGDARGRLAVYNRQYWFRLLTVMQTSWPLTARLLGLFHFNVHAQQFLLRVPPAHYDLRQVTLGFDAFLADAIRVTEVDRGPRYQPLPTPALLEAAALDAAFARVFHAPAQPRFDPSQYAPQDIVQRKLVSSAAYARIVEHWPLTELRVSLRDDTAESAVDLPAQLPAAQSWAMFRNATGVAQVRLAPLEARLLSLLETQPLGAALAQLEAEAPAELRADLPARTQAWIARGVADGFWVGFSE